MNITIKVTKSTHDDREGYASIEVTTDGNTVAEGYIGGEPEDNRITRDYRWIVPMLEALAKTCGATVNVEETEAADA
jgi:hypothetical protein